MIEKLLDKEIQNFILENENADPFALSLKNKEFKGIPIKELAAQIAARKMAKTKLPDWYATDSIIYPPKISMEQCSSQLTAEYKANLVRGKSFIDLTGGAGVDTAAFSKRFHLGAYVEQNKHLYSITKHNINVLGIDNYRCLDVASDSYIVASSCYCKARWEKQPQREGIGLHVPQRTPMDDVSVWYAHGREA